MNTDKSRVSTKCKMRLGQFRYCPIFSSGRRHRPVTCREHRPAGDDPAGRGFQR